MGTAILYSRRIIVYSRFNVRRSCHRRHSCAPLYNTQYIYIYIYPIHVYGILNSRRALSRCFASARGTTSAARGPCRATTTTESATTRFRPVTAFGVARTRRRSVDYTPDRCLQVDDNNNNKYLRTKRRRRCI